MTQPVDPNPIEAAMDVRDRTRRECALDLALWEHGIDLLLGSLGNLRGTKYEHPDADEEPAHAVLIAQAANHELAMYSLALDGYYIEVLALVRSCVERWLAWWYVTVFPREASRFIRQGGKDTPDWNTMLTRLERGTQEAIIRDWRAWLNKLAHVDKATLGLMWEPVEDDEPLIRLGPNFDRTLLEDCIGEATAVIPPLLEIVDKMCERYGVRPFEPGAAMSYLERVRQWAQQLEQRRDDDPNSPRR